MALPDYFVQTQGTAVIWRDSGGTGGTAVITLDALADGSARMGAAVDLGSDWNREYLVTLVVETGTAPTAGNRVDLYFACSYDNSLWPAGVSGSDGAWPSDGNEDEWAVQLGWPVTSLLATNDGNTTQVQNPVIWRPSGRYVAPVVDNNLGQGFRDQATAANNTSRIILVPLREAVVDT
jgi:hypothetical protein